ncbi:hypothetical protein [Porcipelethomonas sp.]|uniref:hypothetical protein n=1 Tax=Porcipelethomonas sp. TaxID=2981675 RepID=UPI003EF9E713
MENIKTNKYEIVLSSPIGDKKGMLTTEISGDKINGIINIMKYDNFFSGNVDEEGNCHISGALKTIIRNTEYKATGFLDSDKITLVLETDKRKLILTGTALISGGDKT